MPPSLCVVSQHFAPSFDGYLAPSTDFVIGGPWSGVFDNGFAGVVVDVRLWNDARTAASIESTLNSVFSVPTANLISYYNFENTTDSVVGIKWRPSGGQGGLPLPHSSFVFPSVLIPPSGY
jgi:hypothetical protein